MDTQAQSRQSASSITQDKHISARLVLLFIFVVGGLVRFYPALTHEFPLQDGGLFLLMSQQIREHGFALPATVPYGTFTEAVPFCYPPLAFYFAAFLNLLGFSFETILRFAPAFWATATIYAFWRFALTFLKSHPKSFELAGLATSIWALLPTSFQWLLMGGGLTRAPGLFFALLGAESAIRLWRDGKQKKLWSTTIFFALAILTHLERAHFLAFALLLFWAFYAARKHWQSVWQLAVIFAGAILLTSPWWALCVSRFGFEPFLSAMDSGGNAWHAGSLLRRTWPEALFPLVSLIAYIGMLYHWRRLLLMALWVALILLTEVRTPSNFIIVPIAISVAFVIVSIQRPILRLGLATVTLTWLGLQAGTITLFMFSTLPPADRAAMAWVKNNSPSEDRFLLIPIKVNRVLAGWAGDLSSEWFPALAERQSVLTVQGTEWLPNQAFARQYNTRVEVMTQESWPKMEAVASDKQIDFDWVYTNKENDKVTQLIQSQLRQSPEFKLAYENKKVLIFQRRKVTSPPAESNRAPSP